MAMHSSGSGYRLPSEVFQNTFSVDLCDHRCTDALAGVTPHSFERLRYPSRTDNIHANFALQFKRRCPTKRLDSCVYGTYSSAALYRVLREETTSQGNRAAFSKVRDAIPDQVDLPHQLIGKAKRKVIVTKGIE